MKKSLSFVFCLLFITSVSNAAFGASIKVVSGHDGSPVRGVQVVIMADGKDMEMFTGKNGEIKLQKKLAYGNEIFFKKRGYFKRFIKLKRQRGVKPDFDNFVVDIFKKIEDDGVFIVTENGYEEMSYNPVEQAERSAITEMFITGKPTVVDASRPLKIIENNMDDEQMIHRVERGGLFAADPPDKAGRFNVPKYKPVQLNQFVILHVPKLDTGLYAVFPQVYSKYYLDDAFFFRLK